MHQKEGVTGSLPPKKKNKLKEYNEKGERWKGGGTRGKGSKKQRSYREGVKPKKIWEGECKTAGKGGKKKWSKPFQVSSFGNKKIARGGETGG